jgi:hypothetical protein
MRMPRGRGRTDAERRRRGVCCVYDCGSLGKKIRA